MIETGAAYEECQEDHRVLIGVQIKVRLQPACLGIADVRAVEIRHAGGQSVQVDGRGVEHPDSRVESPDAGHDPPVYFAHQRLFGFGSRLIRRRQSEHTGVDHRRLVVMLPPLRNVALDEVIVS